MKRTLDLISFAGFTFIVVFIISYSAVSDHNKLNQSTKNVPVKDPSAKLLSLQAGKGKTIPE